MTRLAISSKAKWLGLFGWVAVAFAPSAAAAFVETGTWYESLNKPAWTPPSSVFAPVWTTLYLLMGIAAWRVWLRDGFGGAGRELTLFLIHLLFIAAWSWLFFGLHQLVLSAIDIIVLWTMIVGVIILFWRRDKAAGWILLPYLAWVSYALTLNIGIVAMN